MIYMHHWHNMSMFALPTSGAGVAADQKRSRGTRWGWQPNEIIAGERWSELGGTPRDRAKSCCTRAACFYLFFIYLFFFCPDRTRDSRP